MNRKTENKRHRLPRFAVPTLLIAAVAWSLAARYEVFGRRAVRAETTRELEAALPGTRQTGGYVSSATCRSCHPGEHASWHRSFHRTMTQEALPENVMGDFNGQTIRSDGLAYRVFREGDEFRAEMPDPDGMMYVVQGGRNIPLDKIPRIERRVVMATGSHHYQTYWVESPKYPGLLQTLPLVYLPGKRRWIPRESAFMVPPHDGSRLITQWNHHCIRCHSTGGNPGLDDATGMLNTKTGELGIACEACHGPAEEHIAANRDPLRRYALHLGGEPDSTIVNPANLDHRASSQVCGQCHGVYVTREEFAMKYAREGVQYRPGDDINRTRYYIRHPATDPAADRERDFEENTEFFRQRWWDDGTILAGGREYSAMMVSKCYTQGGISCLSCHSMHDSDPADQLKRGLSETGMCVQCHDDARFTSEVTTHTRHAADSSGSDCMNCHMPFTAYALLGAIRNHQIASPSLGSSITHGVPNACNLCHLDKSLEWTRARLEDRFKILVPEAITADPTETSAALGWLLKGNAAQRAISAWHMGWAPAIKASGAGWQAPFLANLLNDDYGVVRFIAAQSLKRAPGFEAFEFDFQSTAGERASAAAKAVERWSAPDSKPDRTGSAVMLTDDGRLDRRMLMRTIAKRDNRPVTIQE